MTCALQLQWFIWPKQGEPRRLPLDWTKRNWPQYANSEQRLIQVILKDGAIDSLAGWLERFTAAGEWNYRQSKINITDPLIALFLGKPFPVPELSMYRGARCKVAQVDQLKWRPTRADRIQLTAHLTGKRRIPYARSSQ